MGGEVQEQSLKRSWIVSLAALVALLALAIRAAEWKSAHGWPDPSRPVEAFGNLADWALAIALTSLAAGFVTMCAVQLAKDFSWWRAELHSSVLEDWFVFPGRQTAITDLFDVTMQDDTQSQKEKPIDERFMPLARLIFWGRFPLRWLEVLNLPIEQLTAQLNARFDSALAAPHREGRYLHRLAGREYEKTVGAYRQLWKKHASPGAEVSRADEVEIAELRNALLHAVQRNLDGFQTHAARKWLRWLRLTAITLSAAFALIGGILLSTEALSWSHLWFVALVGVTGGYLAGVMRDAAAVLERLRR